MYTKRVRQHDVDKLAQSIIAITHQHHQNTQISPERLELTFDYTKEEDSYEDETTDNENDYDETINNDHETKTG